MPLIRENPKAVEDKTSLAYSKFVKNEMYYGTYPLIKANLIIMKEMTTKEKNVNSMRNKRLQQHKPKKHKKQNLLRKKGS